MAKGLLEKRKMTIGRKRFIFLAVAMLCVELSGATISGVYFYTIRSAGKSMTRKMIQLDGGYSGGVVGVTFYPYHLSNSSSSVNIQTVINHIQHIVDLVGVDYVGIGSDFDGIEVWPTGLEDTSKFPALTLALLERGFNRTDVEKILGGNMMRVFRQVCGK